MDKKKPQEDIIITPEPVSARFSVVPPTVWYSDNFAEDWFRDALNEARTGKDIHALRREIIFATCFLESYIFEWTRRLVQIDEVDSYFPPTARSEKGHRYRQDLKQKWAQIPKELYNSKKIPIRPALDLSDLGTLLKYRHGLIHAAASRPFSSLQQSVTKPFPTKEDLKKLKPGWAVNVAADLVLQFHQNLGTPPPDYLQRP